MSAQSLNDCPWGFEEKVWWHAEVVIQTTIVFFFLVEIETPRRWVMKSVFKDLVRHPKGRKHHILNA